MRDTMVRLKVRSQKSQRGRWSGQTQLPTPDAASLKKLIVILYTTAMYSLCYKYAPCVAKSVIKADARDRMRVHVARRLLHVPLGKELPARWEGGGGGEKGRACCQCYIGNPVLMCI